MNQILISRPSHSMRLFLAAALASCSLLISSTVSAAPCDRVKARPDGWVKGRVNALVVAAHAWYERDRAQWRYERVLDSIAGVMDKCRLAQDEDFRARYPEFLGYVTTLSLALLPDHELGFNVADRVYFAETRQYVEIPDFLLTPTFLRAVSRYETLPQAKAMLRQINTGRAPDDQLLFFSYESRHLGTPDNPDSYRRLLIVVPGDAARRIPEKWVQFGVPDPRAARGSVRNVSVVATLPGDGGTTNVYFKDYFRTYRRNGSITIKGRWELGYGDDNCAQCHKSGVLPIFPEAGSVSKEEDPVVTAVNARFRNYGSARFDRYLDANKLGPGLGSARSNPPSLFSDVRLGSSLGTDGKTCAACHHPDGMGALNWPMDRVLISSYVEGGQMPRGVELTSAERSRLYQKLIQDYFAIDEAKPGILKAWLLGRLR
jgi:mono/diheme cytochrome c family protein